MARRLLDAEEFSSKLDWKQFEGFAELAFKSFGYDTKRNYRIKKPRTEIDLLAISGKKGFAVDCKRWKRTVGVSTMTHVAEKQIRRCKSLLKMGVIEQVVPLILTWKDERLVVLESGVPVVPIQKITDFLLNWDSASDSIRILDRTNLDSEPPDVRNALVDSYFDSSN